MCIYLLGGNKRCFLVNHVQESKQDIMGNKYMRIGPIPRSFLLHFKTIKKFVQNCVSSYVFYTRNVMFTITFPIHDTPGNFCCNSYGIALVIILQQKVHERKTLVKK